MYIHYKQVHAIRISTTYIEHCKHRKKLVYPQDAFVVTDRRRTCSIENWAIQKARSINWGIFPDRWPSVEWIVRPCIWNIWGIWHFFVKWKLLAFFRENWVYKSPIVYLFRVNYRDGLMISHRNLSSLKFIFTRAKIFSLIYFRNVNKSSDGRDEDPTRICQASIY